MAVFEVSRDYLEKFIDQKIETNKTLIDFREELIDVLVTNTSDIDFVGDCDDDNWPFEKKEPTQFYIRDSRYHIRIKDLVVDFFENVFTGSLLDAMLFWFGLSTAASVSTIAITKEFILFVKRVIKEYVIKLDNSEFCIYLQIITHLKEHTAFTFEELLLWLPKNDGDLCNMQTNKWLCPYKGQNQCRIDEEEVKKILKRLLSKDILDYSEDGTYKINY